MKGPEEYWQMVDDDQEDALQKCCDDADGDRTTTIYKRYGAMGNPTCSVTTNIGWI